MLHYSNQLVYYPPNQKMYYFDRMEKRVFEITLDRNDFSKSTIVRLNTTGTPSPYVEPGYAYDSANEIIGGGIFANNFYAFDPKTRAWETKRVQGGTPGTMAFHSIGYDDLNNVFLFVTQARQTWAYRYRPRER